MSDSMAPTGTVDQTTALTVADAAKVFEAFETPATGDNQEGKEERPQAEAEGKAPEGEKPEAEGAESEGEESEGEEPAGDDPESDEPGEEEEQGDKPAADQKFTVRIDGMDETVELSELLAGYSRTSDYTRKTQSLATERKALSSEADAVRGERAEYANLLPKLRAALEQGLGPEPDWAALQAEDPAKFAATYAEREQRKAKLARVQEQERKTAERTQRDHEAQKEQIAIEQNNMLLTALPAWRDQKVRDAEVEMITQSMQAAGFSGHELGILDHRAVILVRKAALYDQIIEQRKGVKGKVQKVPVAKPGAAAARTKSATERKKAASSRLEKTGRVADAAKVFEGFL